MLRAKHSGYLFIDLGCHGLKFSIDSIEFQLYYWKLRRYDSAL